MCIAPSGADDELSALLHAAKHFPGLRGATHLAVVDAAYAMEPGTSLSRMLEASVILSPAALVGGAAPLKIPRDLRPLLAGTTRSVEMVEVDNAAEVGSRVTAVLPAVPQQQQQQQQRVAHRVTAAAGPLIGTATSRSSPAEADEEDRMQPPPRRVQLAPVCVLSQRALMEHAAAATAAPAEGGGGCGSLSSYLAQLLSAGLSVRSWRLEVGMRRFERLLKGVGHLADLFGSSLRLRGTHPLRTVYYHHPPPGPPGLVHPSGCPAGERLLPALHVYPPASLLGGAVTLGLLDVSFTAARQLWMSEHLKLDKLPPDPHATAIIPHPHHCPIQNTAAARGQCEFGG